jgi:glycosyltransferase involved in cell wall biosynthesis
MERGRGTADSDQPLVSVLMASYRAAEFIGESLDSVLAQSYPHLEVLVADDCSGDGTVEIAQRYAERDPRVVVLPGERNLGAWRNRDRALQRSRGELLTQLDADDLWMPDKIERQVAVMRERPRVGLVYTGLQRFDSATRAKIGEPDRADRDGDVLGELWGVGNFIGALTAMWRREAMSRRGVTHLWAHDEPHLGDDYNLWLLISLDWEVAGIDRTLALYRRHSANLTDTAGLNQHLVYLRLLRHFARDYPEVKRRLGPVRRKRLARELRYAGMFESRRGRRRRALALWVRCLFTRPATALRPQLSAITIARILTRPIQPSFWRARLPVGRPSYRQRSSRSSSRTSRIFLAGTPTTTARGSTSSVTTAPAPTNASSPISTPGQMTAPPPTRQARRRDGASGGPGS